MALRLFNTIDSYKVDCSFSAALVNYTLIPMSNIFIQNKILHQAPKEKKEFQYNDYHTSLTNKATV